MFREGDEVIWNDPITHQQINVELIEEIESEIWLVRATELASDWEWSVSESELTN